MYVVYTICGVTHTTKDSIEADFWAELAQIQAESIGWIPLDEGVYLHIGDETSVIEVVGIAKSEMQGSSILWVF
jgi:hypothetical protein